MINVAILFGGKSPEHEVSVISANQAIEALKGHDRYNIIPIYVSKKGDWYTHEKLSNLKNYKDLSVLLKESHQVDVSLSRKSFFYTTTGFFKKTVEFKIDVAFPVFHGRHGEDGGVQGLFELMDIPYVGSNVLASATTMDKVASKMILRECGINTLPYDWCYSDEWLLKPNVILDEIEAKFTYPLIVKPSDLGSSIGISKANNRDGLEEAIHQASTYSTRILIEPAITNLREINCSVMGTHGAMETSVCEQPVGSDEILSFTDKYKSGGSKSSKGMTSLKRKIPADITPEQEVIIKSMAKATFKAFDSSGLVRIDFMIDLTNGEIYVNEINTIPGSLSFYLWQYSDINFTQLCERLLKIAIKKYSEKERLTFTFDANLLADFTGGKAGGGKMGKA
jgi:D-alanine-D-alanine ligase